MLKLFAGFLAILLLLVIYLFVSLEIVFDELIFEWSCSPFQKLELKSVNEGRFGFSFSSYELQWGRWTKAIHLSVVLVDASSFRTIPSYWVASFPTLHFTGSPLKFYRLVISGKNYEDLWLEVIFSTVYITYSYRWHFFYITIGIYRLTDDTCFCQLVLKII